MARYWEYLDLSWKTTLKIDLIFLSFELSIVSYFSNLIFAYSNYLIFHSSLYHSTVHYITIVHINHCTHRLQYCTDVLMYWCTTVLLYYSTTLLLYYSTTLLLYYCTTVYEQKNYKLTFRILYCTLFLSFSLSTCSTNSVSSMCWNFHFWYNAFIL